MGRHPIPENRCARLCDCGEHGFAGLTRGYVAFFSPWRLPEVAPFRWYASTHRSDKIYARSKDRGRWVLMHANLCPPDPGKQVDHRDGDSLNNRDSNLRQCSAAENMRNRLPRRIATSSPFKGVSRAGNGRWQVHICVDFKRRCLGIFSCPVEGAIAYDRAAKSLHGEFARTNSSLGLLHGPDGKLPKQVQEWLDGVIPPSPPRHRRKLSDDDVLTMRRMRIGGATYVDIGIKFGVRTDYARDVVIGKDRRSSPGPLALVRANSRRKTAA